MDFHSQVLQIVKQIGPIVPVEITKRTGANTILASAVLSELKSKGLIMISTVKVGGSPLYYAPGQERNLERFADHLNEKDRRAYELLRQRKILFDKELDPLNQVAMRKIKDYAVPFEITVNNQNLIVWKYYLVSKEEATEILRQRLSPGPQTEEKPQQKPSQKPETDAKEEIQKPKKPEAKIQHDEKQMQISAGSAQEKEEQSKLPDDPFFLKIHKNMSNRGVTFYDVVVNRKNSDIDMILKLQTSIGVVEFYAKAKSKKTVNDGDISSAILTAEGKKMPLVFITTGKITKKAEEMISSTGRKILIVNV